MILQWKILEGLFLYKGKNFLEGILNGRIFKKIRKEVEWTLFKVCFKR